MERCACVTISFSLRETIQTFSQGIGSSSDHPAVHVCGFVLWVVGHFCSGCSDTHRMAATRPRNRFALAGFGILFALQLTTISDAQVSECASRQQATGWFPFYTPKGVLAGVAWCCSSFCPCWLLSPSVPSRNMWRE